MEFRVLTWDDMPQIVKWRNAAAETLRTPFLLNDDMQHQWYKNVICDRKSTTRYWGIFNDDYDSGAELYEGFHIQTLNGSELLISNFEPSPGKYYRDPKEYTRSGIWNLPNCPYCQSRDVQKLWKRVTKENGSRNWIPQGFTCNSCGQVYL